MSAVRITSVGLTADTKLLFSLRVEMIRLADGTQFTYDEDIDAPLALVNPNSQSGQAVIARAARSPRGQRIIVCGSDVPGLLCVAPPFRTEAMQVALASALSLRNDDTLGDAMRAEIRPSRLARQRPLEAATHALQQSLLQRGLTRLVGFGQLDVVLSPETQTAEIFVRPPCTGRWWNHLEASSAVFLVPVREAIDPAAVTVSYDLLRWHFALRLCTGLLLPKIAGYSHFAFNGWPNFGALGATRDQLRIAALLVNRAATLAQICEAIGCPRAQVVAFLNACELLGKLKAPESTAAPVSINAASAPTAKPNPKPARAGFIGMLGKLRDALTLARN